MPGSLVLINPRAARVRDGTTLTELAERLEDVLRRRDGAAPRLVQTASADEVAPLAEEALRDEVASVVGVGGDGTLRAIASVLAGSDTPLARVPAGTGNQLASVLGVPRSPADAVATLADAQVRTLDLGEAMLHRDDGAVETMIFVIGCGAGFDAELMATTPGRPKRYLGSAAYFVRAAWLALRPTTVHCRITVDEEVVEMPVTTALVGNAGQLVPGRLDLRLPLDPEDGLLDLIAVDASGPWRGLRGLLDQLRRTELGGGPSGGSVRLRGRVITLEPEVSMPLEVDGDPLGTGWLEARVLPAALRVLVPR